MQVICKFQDIDNYLGTNISDIGVQQWVTIKLDSIK